MNIKFLSVFLTILLIPSVTAQNTINLPIFGEISIELPIPVLGMALGFFDGAFNPCALSVFFFLIAYLMSLGSRRKCLTLGLTYCFTILVVYFLFMYGASTVLSVVGYLQEIKTIIGAIIILAGLIEVKDFFFYGKWVSLKIPKKAKPRIEKLVSMATIPSAILLGMFVSLVEIPCAGVFPFIYIAVLTGKAFGLLKILYILWYCVFFVLPLMVLTTVFYFGLIEVERAEEKRRRIKKYMRLVSGLIMLLLGLGLLFRVI